MLLESKADRWQAQRTALIESIEDLAAFYQALQALPRSTSTADLSEWFEHLIDQVSRPRGMAFWPYHLLSLPPAAWSSYWKHDGKCLFTASPGIDCSKGKTTGPCCSTRLSS